MTSHPFTWEDSVQKFDRLTASRIDDGLNREVKHAVRSLESIQVSDLMELLGLVKARPIAARRAVDNKDSNVEEFEVACVPYLIERTGAEGGNRTLTRS